MAQHHHKIRYDLNLMHYIFTCIISIIQSHFTDFNIKIYHMIVLTYRRHLVTVIISLKYYFDIINFVAKSQNFFFMFNMHDT